MADSGVKVSVQTRNRRQATAHQTGWQRKNSTSVRCAEPTAMLTHRPSYKK